ncbi:hypothetical protein [Faecalibacterium prausnitzii]|uniref:Tat pathway signal sequence domain protein n=1 Tax=Faecalibacterium prausnitzii TaxID=853 RepID=A0A2A7AQA2_9FIRM|nr:hypothetical protein [Faecalibacterium prausnitzii]PDX81306.1 hypothetical protein CGS58_08580 [Faecalibacterium prausnitzii]
MASMSRRVFLKCVGAAALAVTASGIFAGCSEEGGGSKNTVYGANETVQINGVNVKLLGYQQGFASELAGNYADKTLIAICFGLDNQSDKAIQMGNTAQNKLDDVWKAIKNNDFGKLGESEFVVVAKDKKLGHAAIGYSGMTPNAGIGDILGAGFLGTLEPQKSGCIKVYAIVPSDWEQIGIQYTPYFAPNETRSFVLNRTNKL